MGSLMSGWSSQVLGDRKARLMRNRSLTKEDVEAFWRQHGRPDNSQGSPLGSPRAGDVSPLPSPRRSELQQESPLAARRLVEAIRSLPSPTMARGTRTDVPWPSSNGQSSSAHSEPSSPATRVEGFPENASDGPSTSRDWWTRSSWAFLNEPPQEEVLFGRARSYTCDQFHVSRIVTGNG